MATFKRSLAMILCVMMLLTATPLTALAEEAGTDSQEPVVETQDIVVNETEPSEEVEQSEEAAQPEEEVQTAAVSATDVVKVVDGEGNETGYKSLQAAFDGFAPSNNTYGGTYVITLLGDTSGVNKNLQYPTSPLDITLDLNGHTITGDGSSVAVVINFGAKSSAGCVFTIKDSSGNNSGVITGGKGGVKLDGKGSTLNFMGGTITGNHGASKGGGIFMGATAFLNMTGGIITGNSVTGTSANSGLGGGVLANYATISGGAIYGNSANGGTNVASGRGGGVCTEITRTKGYNTLTIYSGTVFGNTATNAGDDVMAQGNGMSSVKFSFSIGTENWFVDGWNGKKATAGNGEQPRYSADSAVAYTDGGWVDQYNKSIGLKYVVAAEPEKPVAPEAPTSSYDVSLFDIVCEYANYTLRYSPPALPAAYYSIGDVYEENGEYFCDITVALKAFWEEVEKSYWDDIACKDTDHAYVDEFPEEVAIKFVWNAEAEKWDNAEELKVYTITCAPVNVTPEAPTMANVNPSQTLISAVCDNFTGKGHEQIWYFHDGAIIETGEVAQDDNGLWTCVITFDAVKYVETFNELTKSIHGLDIVHELTDPTQTTVTAALVWNAETEQWDISVPGVIHTVCKNPVTGTIARAYLRSGNGRIYTDLLNVSYNESVALELYSGDKLLTTAVLNSTEYPGPAVKKELTGSICVETYNDSDTWVIAEPWLPLDSQMPTEIRLVVDGVITDTCTLIKSSRNGEAMTQEDWINFPGTYAIGGKIGSVYTATNGMSADLSDVLAFTDVTVKVCSGDQLLTTVSDREGALTMGIYRKYLTVSVRTNGESSSWEATPWQPLDEVIPTKLELYIDGVLCDTKTFTLSAEKWAALPGTEARPEAPQNNGSNVTQELITILCNTEDGHAPKTYGWGDPAANFVFPKGSEPVWNSELNAWTISVRIESIMAYYVGLQFNKEYNGIQHKTVDGLNTIDTTLVWDAEANLWQTLTGKPFEVHTTCQAAPEAPAMGFHLGKFQIKVVGTVKGVEKVWHETLHAETVTLGQVKGNRVDGFTVDVTVSLANGDAYLAAWLAKHAPEAAEGDYLYNWEKTDKTVTFTLKYTGDTTGELYDGPEYWAAEGSKVYTAYVSSPAPEAPDKYGKNVTPALIRVICDSDPERHPAMDISWQHQSTNVYHGAQVEWDAELGTWTIKVRIDGITNYYVWLNFEKKYNDILHDPVPNMPLPEETYHIDTYLKWDDAAQLWVTLDEKPIEIHTTCKTHPSAPTAMALKSYQVQVYGIVGGEEKLYAIYVDPASAIIGEIKGSREDGFTVDVTFNIAEDDYFQSGWLAKRDPNATVDDYTYDWSRTPESITITLKYNESTTGNLYGTRSGDWVLASNGKTYGAIGKAYMIPAMPASPEQQNVTDKLVTVICDSDGNRHQTVYGKWYPQHCKTTSDIVWNAELNAWTVDVRIGSLYIMYVNQLEDANNGITHELTEDITTVYTTLVWDAAQKLWMPKEAIELHTTCRTAPLAPIYKQLSSYQVKVWGNVIGKDASYTTSIPASGYTLSEVYGSREEGFFVDVTITLNDSDIYISNWIAKKAPEGITYGYDWDKTPQTVTFTLKYNGSLTGTLYGNRHAANTNYDWVLASTGKHFGVITEAYAKPIPESATIVFRYWLGTNMGTFNQKLTYGEPLTLRANTFKRTGYTFDHWNSKRDTDDGKFTFTDGQTLTAEQVHELYLYALSNDGKAYLNAYWKANDYTLSFNVGYDAENPASKTVTYDSPVGELPVLTRKGYDFLGWLDAEGNEVTAETIYQVAGDSTLTANWKAHTFTIVYRYWLGTTMGSFNHTVSYDQVVTLRANSFKRHGYTFDHWNSKRDTDDGKFTFADCETLSVETVNALYDYAMANGGKAYLNAYWKANTFTIVYRYWLGTTMGSFNHTVSYDQVVTLRANSFKRHGYTFDHWNSKRDTDDGKFTFADCETLPVETVNALYDYAMANGGKAYLNAYWKANTFTIVYRYWLGTTMGSFNHTVSYDQVVTLRPNSFKRTGYTFDHWNSMRDTDDGKFTFADCETLPAETVNALYEYAMANGGKAFLNAYWKANNYTLTLNPNGGKVDPATITVTYDAAIGQLPVPTRKGYDFLGWLDAEGHEVTAETIYQIAGDSTLTANWENHIYSISVESNEGGKITVQPTGIFNEIVNISIAPDTGYRVISAKLVYESNGIPVTTNLMNATRFKMPSADVTVIVEFEQVIYSITVQAGEHGTIEVQDTAVYGVLVPMTVTPDEGYSISVCKLVYQGKNGTVTTTINNPTRFKMPAADVTLIVEFKANDYTLTLNPNGGKVDPATITVTYDAAIGELPVPTKVNSIFDGWHDADGNEVTPEVIYKTAGDTTITAKWIQHPGSSSTNVTKELFTIQCSVKHEHSWLCNWFGSHVSLVKDSVKWNEETGRWEAQAKIGSSMLSQINSTQPRKNYFGGITHHYDTTNYVFDLYYDPSVTGLNSQGKEVTGLWLPAQEYVVPVYCYTEPSMPDISKITATALWMRDAGNKNSTHSQKFTVKQLVEGSYTVGQMYTEGGKFYVNLTLTDLAPYIQALGEKTGKTYVIGDWQNHLTLKDCTFTLVYTGSTTDYKQDGTGWSVDAASWNNNSEKLNGKSLWLTEQFTVTYTDGVEDKEIFADQVFTVNAYTENGNTANAVTDFAPTATPAVEDPTRAGYIFAGWTPAVAETVTETVTYTANWIQHPGSSSTNVTKELFTIQCSVKHEHSWLCNWFGSHVSLVKDSVKWNEETGRWEAQAKIGSSMLSQINSTQPRKNYFGGITHHYDTTNYVFDLYYDPSVTGLNSQGKEVTGLWLPAQEYVVPVYCYTEPSMPDISKITATALWMRDAGNKNSTHSQKFTVKQLVEGSYTVGQMYTEGGKFYVNLTLTDLAPYIQALAEKTGKTYVIGDWQNHLTLKDCTFTLVYTGSTTDYKQDGTGWSVDAASWNNNSEKLNGKSLWLTEQFTVTYTDGVEDKEIFADQVFTVNAYTENGKTSNAVTDFAPTATPVVENLEYIGYTFTGWTPEWSETVTGNADYTATWSANTYTVSFNTNGGPEAEPIVVTFDSKYGNLPSSSLTGLSSRKTDWYLVDENGNVTDIQIKNTTVVSVARDHTLFLKRDVLAPTLKIALTVPGGISNDYKYYIPGNSTRVLTVTVSNMNAEVLDYTYQWFKDGTAIEGATEAVLTLPGNVSDSGTYKVVVTAKLKDGSSIVVMNDTASAEKEQKVQIMRAANTLRYNDNFGETPVTSDSYFGGATATLKRTVTRTGYTFTGWNTKADGTGENFANGDTVEFPGDNGNGGIVLELFAQWIANEYTVSFNTNGGPEAEPIVVTFDSKYGNLPSSSLTGLSSRKTDWYLVDENGNVTDVQIKNTTVVSVARDHTLFLKRDVLAPTLKIALTVPGGISNDYKYYIPDNSTRVLTVTVSNMNAEVLDYTYQWFKDGTAIEGATEAVLTLPGNVSDSGTYKVVVTAKLKDGSSIVVMNDTASAEKEQKVQIMRAANTLRYNDNFGETPVTSDSYFGGATATLKRTVTRTGYTFTGWNTKADGTGENFANGDTVEFPGDNGNGGIVLELFAQWIANEYEITLNSGEGYFETAALSETDAESAPLTSVTLKVTFGQPIGEMPTPVKRGYTFNGWFDAEGNLYTADTIYSIPGNLDLTAKFTVNTYKITWEINEWTVVDPMELTVTYGQTIGELPIPKLTYWKFCCWKDAAGNVVTGDTIYEWDEDIVLTAIWYARDMSSSSSSPKTGDASTAMMISVMALSAAGLVALILSDRKRRAAK